jgi:hypothetical protein
MKITPTVVVSLAFAAGLVGGLLGANVISQANAIEQRVILIDTDAEIANKCNFNKAIVQGYKYYLSVRN